MFPRTELSQDRGSCTQDPQSLPVWISFIFIHLVKTEQRFLVEMNSFFNMNLNTFERFVFSLVALLGTVLSLLNEALPQDYGDLRCMARKRCFHSQGYLASVSLLSEEGGLVGLGAQTTCRGAALQKGYQKMIVLQFIHTDHLPTFLVYFVPFQIFVVISLFDFLDQILFCHLFRGNFQVIHNSDFYMLRMCG